MKKTISLTIAAAAAFLSLSGCSVEKMAGEKVIDFTHDRAIPYLMSQGDLQAACAMGESMGPVLASMAKLDLNPDNIGIATSMASGMCAEFEQRSSEIERMRALHDGQTNTAQDALIREKHGHRLAAMRMISAYENAVSAYGNFDDTQCPKYDSQTDELLSLLGLASGALALLHDFNSEKSVGISLDVPVRIEKAASCFDDEKWWGMPTALRASIWLSIPGSGPAGTDPLEAMQKAAKQGDKQGVVLARAMLVMMAATVGQNDVKCEALAAIPEKDQLCADYAMLNAYANGLMEHQANIAWAIQNGYRAPFMQSTCPGNPAAAAMDDSTADSILGDLLDDEDTSDASSESPASSASSTIDGKTNN